MINQNQLKTYAAQARQDFMQAVKNKAAKFGILSATEIIPAQESGDFIIIGDRTFTRDIKLAYNKILRKIETEGYDELINEIAYSWFNRMIAVRYLEVNQLLPHGYQIIGNPDQPEVMQHLQEINLDGLNRDTVNKYIAQGNKDEELYAYILKTQFAALHKIIPFLFESLDDETNLLMPDGLLLPHSIRQKMAELDTENFKEIEVIGWLYQFYIAEKKDKLMAEGKAYNKEDIPAVTQLFTPKWIVQYMVQNSLGAKWLETYPDSPLKDKMPYYIEPAQQTPEVQAQLDAIKDKKIDPTTITVLDPACGSGHILVVAYDVLKEIYLESGYAPRDIPALILKNNLFGIDLDKRAAQLATFALAMKAANDNPQLMNGEITVNVINIEESNGLAIDDIVNAVNGSNHQKLIRDLFDNFVNAKTYGSLIKIKPEIVKNLDEINDIARGDTVTSLNKPLIDQIKPFVQMAEFLSRKYDCVIANPPYMGSGKYNPVLKDFAVAIYPDSKTDLCTMFMEQAAHLIKNTAFYAMINSESWMFLSSFEKLRSKLLKSRLIYSMAHMGAGAFGGGAFGTTAFVIRNIHLKQYSGKYIGLGDANNGTEKRILFETTPKAFEVIQDKFYKIPGKLIAYWVSESIIKSFEIGTPIADLAVFKHGMSTSDNDKYLRKWYEVSFDNIGIGFQSKEQAKNSKLKWFPYHKGGKYRKWYGNNEYLVNWQNDGQEIKEVSDKKYPYLKGNLDFVLGGQKHFFLPGYTWSALTSSKLSLRKFASGFLFDAKGQCFFSEEYGDIICALLNSRVTDEYGKILSPTVDYNSGVISQIPIMKDVFLTETTNQVIQIRNNVQKCTGLGEIDWNSYETSWDFEKLPMLTDAFCKDTVAASYNAWREQNAKDIAETKRLEEENNNLFIEAYGLSDEITPDVPLDQITLTVNPRYRYGGNATDAELEERFTYDSIKELISYNVGCDMGRYSLDQKGLVYANANNDGFDQGKYTTIPADNDGIIPVTDTAWFDDEDMTKRTIAFVEKVWDHDTLEDNLRFIASALGGKTTDTPSETIRDYLVNGFYKDHLQRYQKRPIYWMFSSGKEKAFQCLVYMHRMTPQTLARIRTQFVSPLMGKLSVALQNIDTQILNAVTATESRNLNKQKDKLNKQAIELAKYDEDLKHAIDQNITIDLDDGIKVNYGKFEGLVAEYKTVAGK